MLAIGGIHKIQISIRDLLKEVLFTKFLDLSLKSRVLKLRFLAFPKGPGGFREVREAGRNHFHLSWYLAVPGITSYGQQKLDVDRACFSLTKCGLGSTV